MTEATILTGKTIDDGRNLVLLDPPLGSAPAYAVSSAVCDNPDCSCDNMRLGVRELIAEGDGYYRVGDVRLGSGDANSAGELKDLTFDSSAVPDEALQQWLREQLCAQDSQAWIRERWRRMRGRCGAPDFPPASLPDEIDGLLPFDEAFPYDFDITLPYQKGLYFAHDCYCLEPGCSCNEVVVQFVALSVEQPEVVAIVRSPIRKLQRPRVDKGGELALDLWNTLIQRGESRRLRERYDRMRKVARRRAAASVSAPAKVNRNAPCPCGSGKKHKRCCGQSA
ncbi:MAG: SEC-C metal-binding domain-containing protein [Myxococcales bacterium]|nr:SEC-C metal-binding domain-containing protein [Myxococcales bacterium]